MPTLAEDVGWKTAILYAQLYWPGTGEKMSGIWWLSDAKTDVNFETY